MRIKNPPNFKGGRKKRDAPSSGCETHVGLYTDEETAFLQAVQAFQKRWGIKFLSHTHYLRILKELGYNLPTKHDQNSIKNNKISTGKSTTQQRSNIKTAKIKKAKRSAKVG